MLAPTPLTTPDKSWALQNGGLVQHAFLYISGQPMTDLGTLSGPKARSRAVSINAFGQVVGYLEARDGMPHAFLYTPGTGMKDLGAFGGSESRAYRINDAGRIVGIAVAGGVEHAFLCNSETAGRNLLAIRVPRSIACGINNAGQVIGNASWYVSAPPGSAPSSMTRAS